MKRAEEVHKMEEDKCLKCDWWEHYIGYCMCPQFCDNGDCFKESEGADL